jgi:hypothetical protein
MQPYYLALTARQVYIWREQSKYWQNAISSIGSKILATVNAPYGARLLAEQLAGKTADPKSTDEHDCSAFSFLSDVSPKFQQEFISEMGLNKADVSIVAGKFSRMVG